MSDLQPVIRALGLLNRPNQYGIIPAGAMFDADNLFLRKPGLLSPQPVLLDWSNGASAGAITTQVAAGLIATDIASQTAQKALGIVACPALTADVLAWFDPNATVSTLDWLEQSQQAFGVNVAPRVIAKRMQLVKHRKRFFGLSSLGTQVWDELIPTTAAQRRSRYAGLPQYTFFPGAAADASGILKETEHATWRVVMRRKYSDGYTVTSPVSVPVIGEGLTGLGQTTITLQIFLPADLLVGLDTLEIYRTKITAKTVDSGPTFYLSRAIPVTAANIGTTINVVDITPDAALGIELYTNPGQEGETANNRQPPYAKNICMFKGYAIYANLVQPPRLKFNAPISGGPFTAAKRSQALASRSVTGTSTNGNPTVTGISAADMVGVQIGQLIVSANFSSGNPHVVSKTGTTITSSVNATASGAHAFFTTDTLFIQKGGAGNAWQEVYWFDGRSFQADLNAAGFIVTTDQAVGGAVQDTGAEYQAEPSRWLTTGDGTISLVATNGQNYAPAIPSPTAFPVSTSFAGLKFETILQPNAVMWSKIQEPETAPAQSTKFVGSGEILNITATRDAVYMSATDTLWRWSGDGTIGQDGANWRADPVDSTLRPTGPRTTASMRDNVYQYGNRGLIRITTDGQVAKLSVDRLDELQGSPYAEEQEMLLVCDDRNNEVWLSFAPNTGGDWYVYNADTDAFTKAKRTSNQVVTAAAYAGMAFNSGQGGIEFFGLDVAAATFKLRHLDAVNPTYQQVQRGNFMPVFGKTPATVKQFQRVTHLFSSDTPTNQVFYAVWNELDGGGLTGQLTVGPTLYADRRIVSWVPMSSAVAQALKVGFLTQASTSFYEYLGFILEFEELTAQQRTR